MRLPCEGKNIPLSKFCYALDEFFAAQNYQITHKEDKEGCYILGRPISHKDQRLPVIVSVTGHPNNFMIELEPLTPNLTSARLHFEASIIGLWAGWDLKRKFDQQDRFIEFEKLFWSHVIKAIADLKT